MQFYSNPTAPQIADIAQSSVEKSRLITNFMDPKVALLSYSTKRISWSNVYKKWEKHTKYLKKEE